MKEKEKAAAGLLYDPCGCLQLSQERQAAKVTLWQYNQCDPRDGARRQRLLKSLLGSSGDGLCIEPPFHCDYGYPIHVGKNVYTNVNLVILDCAPVTLGDNVFNRANVRIYTAGHPLDVARRNQGLEYALPITISNNVWIGGGVTILPGVTIGDNTVIGAGSVVTRDIPAAVLAFGYPCRVSRPQNIARGRLIRRGRPVMAGRCKGGFLSPLRDAAPGINAAAVTTGASAAG